jgi:hypothetical protein
MSVNYPYKFEKLIENNYEGHSNSYFMFDVLFCCPDF